LLLGVVVVDGIGVPIASGAGVKFQVSIRFFKLRIGRIHLLGKGWQSKTDCQSYKCY
jgi:hypothetical protein